MDQYNIAVLMGDGIGPEVVNQSIKVLNKVSSRFGFKVNYIFSDIGAAADKYKNHLPKAAIDSCKKSDSILMGTVGDKVCSNLPLKRSPEQAFLNIKRELNLFADIRPVIIFDSLRDMSPIKEEYINKVKNILIVKELLGGIYFGKKARHFEDGKVLAYDTEMYREDEIIRIAKLAFSLAQKRSKKLVSVSKANMLETSKLWQEAVNSVSEDFKDVKLTHMTIDNCAMQIIKAPSQFDVILTSNLFGDILSVLASVLTGSIGLLAYANVRQDKFGLYGPVGGSALDIAGKNTANPIASILSAAMMLRYSLSEFEASYKIEEAVNKAIKIGRTKDIHTQGTILLSCSEMGDLICKYIS